MKTMIAVGKELTFIIIHSLLIISAIAFYMAVFLRLLVYFIEFMKGD